jgi:hypothetical protein
MVSTTPTGQAKYVQHNIEAHSPIVIVEAVHITYSECALVVQHAK